MPFVTRYTLTEPRLTDVGWLIDQPGRIGGEIGPCKRGSRVEPFKSAARAA